MLYPPAQVGFIYASSVMFKSEAAAFAAHSFFNAIITIVGGQFVAEFRLAIDNPVLNAIGIAFSHIFSISPSYILSWATYVTAG